MLPKLQELLVRKYLLPLQAEVYTNTELNLFQDSLDAYNRERYLLRKYGAQLRLKLLIIRGRKLDTEAKNSYSSEERYALSIYYLSIGDRIGAHMKLPEETKFLLSYTPHKDGYEMLKVREIDIGLFQRIARKKLRTLEEVRYQLQNFPKSNIGYMRFKGSGPRSPHNLYYY